MDFRFNGFLSEGPKPVGAEIPDQYSDCGNEFGSKVTGVWAGKQEIKGVLQRPYYQGVQSPTNYAYDRKLNEYEGYFFSSDIPKGPDVIPDEVVHHGS